MTQTSTLARNAVAVDPAAAHAGLHAGPLLVAAGEGNVNHLLRVTRTLTSRLANEVRVVSVVQPLPILDNGSAPIVFPSYVDAEQELRAGVATGLKAQIDQVAEASHLWRWEVIMGEPAPTIARRARELDASLVIMGIGRHRPLDRLLAAETTLRVIRHATAPVLAVSAAFNGLPKEVVVATDFGPRSAVATELLLPLLAEGGTLHLVHVWEPSGSANAAVLAMEQRYEASLPTRFERFKAALGLPPDITVTFDAFEGQTGARILEYAERHHADLIVAGRQGLNRLARWMVGSVTTVLVRGASCSVLVASEPSVSELDRMQRLLTGTSESHDPACWAELLDDFTHRNAGRRADLQVDDPDFGAQTEERGYAFYGASYDPHGGHVELMLGGLEAGAPHLSRGITDTSGVGVFSDERGHDLGLSIRHGNGQTRLLFSRTS